MNATKPVGTAQPDTRGRVNLGKFLPMAPGIYLVFKEPGNGDILLRPLNNESSEGEAA